MIVAIESSKLFVKMPPTTQPAKSLIRSIPLLLSTLQFYWYIGHVLSLFNFVGYLFYSFLSTGKSTSYYRYTLFFELISYGIVIMQVHSNSKSFNRSRFLRDENVQYFLLALTLWASSFKIGAISGALYSYAIYSFFHSMTYFQANILERIPISLQSQAAINARITYITSNFNQQALFIASTGEVMLFPYFLMAVPNLVFKLFRDPVYVAVQLFTFLALVVFVKLRYNEIQYTQAAVQQLDLRISAVFANPMIPPQISALYNVAFKQFILRYLGPIRISPATSVKKKQ